MVVDWLLNIRERLWEIWADLVHWWARPLVQPCGRACGSRTEAVSKLVMLEGGIPGFPKVDCWSYAPLSPHELPLTAPFKLSSPLLHLFL